jgi:hypothetical protein
MKSLVLLTAATLIALCGCAASSSGSGGTVAAKPDVSSEVSGACVPDCTVKFCGDDGCGGSCGTCKNGLACKGGLCGPCADEDTACDGTTLHQCTKYHLLEDHPCTAESCRADGFKDVADPACGPNGDGKTNCLCLGCDASDTKCMGNTAQSCDEATQKLTTETCLSGYKCKAAKCVFATCTPTCTAGICGGSDGCGGSCGCASGESCQAGKCVTQCAPNCPAKTCGEDGCGGKCECTAGMVCSAGVCEAPCTPDKNYCGGGALHLCDASTGLFTTTQCTTASCQAAGFAALDNPPCGTGGNSGVTCYCKPCTSGDNYCDGDTAHTCDVKSGKMIVQACGAGKTCDGGECGASCVTSADCPTSAPCCDVLSDAQLNPIADHGACVSNSAASACRCSKGAQCSSAVCSPAMLVGNKLEPFKICTKNDGLPYHGCNGGQSCQGAATCCVSDQTDPSTSFCAAACSGVGSCAEGGICSAKYNVSWLSSCGSSTQTCSP